MRCINIGTRGFVPAPPRPPLVIDEFNIPRYIVASADSPLEPHIDFPFKERLQEELLLRDPPQPFPAEPLESELPPLRLRDMLTPKARHQSDSTRAFRSEAARVAAEREERFRTVQSTHLDQRRESMSRSPSPGADIVVASGGVFDRGLIEDKDYKLSEVVGQGSRFNLRFVRWGGMRDTARSSRGRWTSAAAGQPPTVLSGGIGTTFNEDTVAYAQVGRVLNAVVFFQLMATLAMRRLVGFGNCVLEAYCSLAHTTQQQNTGVPQTRR
ncbi:hypothetical protein C8R43DRAFT_1143378 [Mycena crocata]|nr:hypothetical protein C8R43DRAFT_1143378 [Mycena crocata]